MDLEQYLARLSHPGTYFRTDKITVNNNLEFFTKMFECKVSPEMAVMLVGSGIEKYL